MDFKPLPHHVHGQPWNSSSLSIFMRPPYHHRRSTSNSFANRDSQHRATATERRTTTAAQNPNPATSRSFGRVPSSIRIPAHYHASAPSNTATINPHPNTGISCGRLDFVVSSTLCRTVHSLRGSRPRPALRIESASGGSPSGCVVGQNRLLCVAPKQCGLNQIRSRLAFGLSCSCDCPP